MQKCFFFKLRMRLLEFIFFFYESKIKLLLGYICNHNNKAKKKKKGSRVKGRGGEVEKEGGASEGYRSTQFF